MLDCVHESNSTIGCDISPYRAQQCISVTRKAQELPILKDKILQGEITLTKAAIIVPQLKLENQTLWFTKAETQTVREIKKEVAEAQGREELIEVKLRLTKDQFKDLQQAQNILSQKQKKSLTLEETVIASIQTYVTKQDKTQKAVRLLCTSKVKVGKIPFGRVQLPAWITHRVHAKSQGQCEATNPNGQRCDSKRFLEIHHIRPLSKGGTNHPTNLVLLCSGHHNVQHRAKT